MRRAARALLSRIVLRTSQVSRSQNGLRFEVFSTGHDRINLQDFVAHLLRSFVFNVHKDILAFLPMPDESGTNSACLSDAGLTTLVPALSMRVSSPPWEAFRQRLLAVALNSGGRLYTSSSLSFTAGPDARRLSCWRQKPSPFLQFNTAVFHDLPSNIIRYNGVANNLKFQRPFEPWRLFYPIGNASNLILFHYESDSWSLFTFTIFLSFCRRAFLENFLASSRVPP